MDLKKHLKRVKANNWWFKFQFSITASANNYREINRQLQNFYQEPGWPWKKELFKGLQREMRLEKVKIYNHQQKSIDNAWKVVWVSCKIYEQSATTHFGPDKPTPDISLNQQTRQSSSGKSDFWKHCFRIRATCQWWSIYGSIQQTTQFTF